MTWEVVGYMLFGAAIYRYASRLFNAVVSKRRANKVAYERRLMGYVDVGEGQGQPRRITIMGAERL